MTDFSLTPDTILILRVKSMEMRSSTLNPGSLLRAFPGGVEQLEEDSSSTTFAGSSHIIVLGLNCIAVLRKPKQLALIGQ